MAAGRDGDRDSHYGIFIAGLSAVARRAVAALGTGCALAVQRVEAAAPLLQAHRAGRASRTKAKLRRAIFDTRTPPFTWNWRVLSVRRTYIRMLRFLNFDSSRKRTASTASPALRSPRANTVRMCGAAFRRPGEARRCNLKHSSNALDKAEDLPVSAIGPSFVILEVDTSRIYPS